MGGAPSISGPRRSLGAHLVAHTYTSPLPAPGFLPILAAASRSMASSRNLPNGGADSAAAGHRFAIAGKSIAFGLPRPPPQPSTSPGLPSLTIGVQLGGSLAGKLSRELASISSRTMLLPRDRSIVLATDLLLRAFTSMPPRCVSPGLATGTTLRAQRAAVSPVEIVSSARGTRFGNYSDPPPMIFVEVRWR